MNLNCSKTTMLALIGSVMLLGYSPQVLAAGGVGKNPLPTEVQQEKKITGVVSDVMGPVIGASVVVKERRTVLLPTLTENSPSM